METIIGWLTKHKGYCTVAVVLFFGLNAGLHWEISKLIGKLGSRFGVLEVSAFFLFFNVLLFCSAVWYFHAVARRKPITRLHLMHLFSTLFLTAASFLLLVTKNLEGVHFLQYAILAFLLFPLVNNYWETIYWTTILGIADEALQYWGLIRHWNYFDFNDVVLNLLGAAIGVSILILHGFPVRELVLKRSAAILSLASLLISGLVLFAAGILAFYPSDDGTLAFISLRRIPPESEFWRTYAYPSANEHHILEPAEGILLILLLLMYYLWLEMRVQAISKS